MRYQALIVGQSVVSIADMASAENEFALLSGLRSSLDGCALVSCALGTIGRC
ncbi:hypothetical protein ALQ95_02673 [Pseudomonas syringae pv. ribicola]|uniref:Uncharacterized protein n=1 Tax=Pseudomonas syringae pv. ribicola TaxID=55398 RepID=A0A3M2VVD1_PSESI|nr:hypothetical protein ALQ95_02673 [Pseudomonas syringae pv. ribicola]